MSFKTDLVTLLEWVLELIFYILHQISWFFYLVFFENLYQFPVACPRRVHFGALSGPKNNYILNFNNFSITRPIVNLKVSLDRACQDLKYYSKKEFHKNFFYSYLETPDLFNLLENCSSKDDAHLRDSLQNNLLLIDLDSRPHVVFYKCLYKMKWYIITSDHMWRWYSNLRHNILFY